MIHILLNHKIKLDTEIAMHDSFDENRKTVKCTRRLIFNWLKVDWLSVILYSPFNRIQYQNITNNNIITTSTVQF